jgi:hypothetical protein
MLNPAARLAQNGANVPADAVPSVPGRAPFAWVLPVLRVSDETLLPEVGLDAIFYVKFCRMVRGGAGAWRGTRAVRPRTRSLRARSGRKTAAHVAHAAQCARVLYAPARARAAACARVS